MSRSKVDNSNVTTGAPVIEKSSTAAVNQCKPSKVDKFIAWHVTINDPHYCGGDGDLGIHYFDTRNQARARGAYEAEMNYTQIRAVRAPDWDLEKVPGAFLQNGRVVQPGERP